MLNGMSRALPRSEQPRILLSESRRIGETELSEILGGVPVGTIRHWRLHHKGPRYAKIGRHVKYDLRDVEAWIAGRTVETNETAVAR
jgi:hypothetical protein